MSKSNKIFCTAPFTTLRIEKTEKHGLVYKPGCVYKPVGEIPTLSDFMHGTEISELRDNVCNGDTFKDGCRMCSNSEKLGLRSIRMKMNEKSLFSDNLDIKLLDIAYSNICNLGCLMCSPSSSSFLASERFQIGIVKEIQPYFDNTDYAIEAMDSLPNLESVSLIGGEFFIFKNNLIILDKIIEKQLQCRIVTNATIISDELLSRLSQLGNKLELQISVDGSNECYEFMRYPAKWDVLKDNVIRLQKALPYAKMNFQIIVQALNIQHIPSSLSVLNEFRLPMSLQNLSDPSWLSWNILTDEEKCDLENHLMVELGTARITQKQKNEILKFIDGIKLSSFNERDRSYAIDTMRKTFHHRKLSNQVISKQLGIFHNLTKQLTS
jgi:MoaA/NifB/PqqE/SkfB family radical SAM enzyme